MVVIEHHRFFLQFVDSWSNGIWVAVAGEIAVSLVIGNDEDDVWFIRRLKGGKASG